MERLTLGLSGVFAFAIIGIWIVAVVGWIMNIVKLFGFVTAGFAGNEVEAVLRGVGVFAAPFGAVLGWF